MKKLWQTPTAAVIPVDKNETADLSPLSDTELKIRLEQAGHYFQKKYQASQNFIHRKIADSDVLISVGSNIANFNGYIELNESAADLWKKLQEPSRVDELEQVLETKYDIDHETAVEHVLVFLKELQEHEMVVAE